MKQLTGNQVRKMFLDFFESKGHKVEPSHSLIPNDDPTLLWINAGVAALKKYFDGTIKPENPRITNAQKSIRTNDIENVGKTARHHTFFEMLGNFSIGDYFKKEAIDFAWELLTDEKWFAFDKDKLYITVHDHDEEAYNYWVDVIGVDPSHMLKTPGNFWEIGEGPCGPDSEIFYDRGEKYDPEGLGIKLFYEELENDRYIEIWNLVFSQYNSQEGVDRNDYEELPQKNIDTGMGLERITSIIQGGETNFDTDFFLPIIHEVEKLANVSYQENKMAYRVIADHIRTVTFALADGALFDNAGRGYVLRRILRRAVRYGKQIGIEKAFMYNLVGVVSEIMKEFYDYLPEKVSYISDLVKKEEEAFHKTLSNGEKLLSGLIKKNSDGIISGKDAFKLYDTYGFPFELTLEIAQESNLKVDEEGFKEELKLQQMRSRGARVDNESMTSQKPDLMAFDLPSTFEYDPTNIRGVVIGLFKDGVKTDQLDDYGEIVFDVTTFYAEMGGQVADHGVIKDAEGQVVANVLDVQHAPHGQNLHSVETLSPLKVGESYTLEIDKERRAAVVKNHTATHLLHAALHNIVGNHALQAGSLNEVEFLRFDFTHFAQVTKEELAEIERQVNEVIWQSLKVETVETDIATAKEMGAMALFGEKYGKNVRVVKIGDYSIELCGGTHTQTTSEIGLFKIVKEEGIGSGVRRIIAVTGQKAYEAFKDAENTLNEVATMVKAPQTSQVLAKVTSLQDELKTAQKENDALAGKLAASQSDEIFKNVQTAGSLNFIASEVTVPDANGLRNLADIWKQKELSDVLVLVAKIGEKVSLLVASKSSDVKAGNLVKELAPFVDGRGGGKPDMAMAGGSKAAGIPELLAAVAEKLA